MRRDRLAEYVLIAIGVPAAIWLGLLLAPVLYGDRAQLLTALSDALANPAAITIVEDSLRAVLLALGAYVFGIGIFFSTRRNWRRREEHGSAKWGEASQIARRYRDRHRYQNKLLTKGFALGLDGKKHKRNLNVLVVGGSGSGKLPG